MTGAAGARENDMERTEINWTDHFARVTELLTGGGLLLGAYDGQDQPNAMTIGWGSLGSIWSMPLWIVLVRPSRYTYECIERHDAFTVNVPAAGMDQAWTICGTRSGRDGDKLVPAGLTAEKGLHVDAPTMAECPIVYECEVLHHNDVEPGNLVRELMDGPYANGDFHRVYYGRILSTRAAPDAADLIG